MQAVVEALNILLCQQVLEELAVVVRVVMVLLRRARVRLTWVVAEAVRSVMALSLLAALADLA
jgi:hypothetical protein